jgi:enolase
MRFTSQWRTTTESVVRLRKCARGSATLGGYTVVVPHRSGETEEHDPDIALATHCARSRPVRCRGPTVRPSTPTVRAKYNELIHIAEELGTQARYADPYAGIGPLHGQH